MRSASFAMSMPESDSGIDIAKEARSEEHTSELQSLTNLVCRLLLEKKKRHQHEAARTPTLSNTTRPPAPIHIRHARKQHRTPGLPTTRTDTAGIDATKHTTRNEHPI